MIPEYTVDMTNHVASVGESVWRIIDLIELAKDETNTYTYDLDVLSLDLDVIVCGKRNVFSDVQHIKGILKADLTKPVIVADSGWVLDGWHRIIKALVTDVRYIPAIRFKVTPPPSYVEPNEKATN